MRLWSILLFSLYYSHCIGQSPNMKVKSDGVLLPKGDHSMIQSPEGGLLMYDTLTTSFWYFDNITWEELGNDGDKDSLNEIQNLSVSVTGDTMYLENGGFLIVPGISDANYIKDADGNVYTEVVIGNNVWLKENLKTTKYNDGTPIPKIENASDWDNWGHSWNGQMFTDVYAAYCWYNNDSTSYHKFGALYNWGVVDSTINGGKNVCPDGFLVPTSSQLVSISSNIYQKRYGPGEWWNPTGQAPLGCDQPVHNQTGFSLVGSGHRDWTSPFLDNKDQIWLWSRTGGLMMNIHALRIDVCDSTAPLSTNRRGGQGFSIRCIKE